jgi:hypothetical protein
MKSTDKRMFLKLCAQSVSVLALSTASWQALGRSALARCKRSVDVSIRFQFSGASYRRKPIKSSCSIIYVLNSSNSRGPRLCPLQAWEVRRAPVTSTANSACAPGTGERARAGNFSMRYSARPRSWGQVYTATEGDRPHQARIDRAALVLVV